VGSAAGEEELLGAAPLAVEDGLAPLVAGFGGSAASAPFVAGGEAFSCEAPHAVARVTASESTRELTATGQFGRHVPGIGRAS
jgi:hypothetical protein